MSAVQHKQVVFDGPAQWPGGGAPMGMKRKKEGKKKKDKKKGGLDISTPSNVRHVGMQNVDQYTNPLAGRSNFPVEHLATMAVTGKLAHISPYESIRKVRDLVQKGNVHTREIILSVSAAEIIVKDGSSRTSLNVIPLVCVIDCKYIQDSGGNVLMLSFQDQNTNQPRVHFFQCTKGSAEMVCNQVNQGRRLLSNSQRLGKPKVRVGIDESQALRDNWILEQRQSSPPPPFSPPPVPQTLNTLFSPNTQPPPPSGPPPPPGNLPLQATQQSPGPPSPLSTHVALPASTAASNNHQSPSGSMAQSPQSPAGAFLYQPPVNAAAEKRSGDFVSRASVKYVSNVHKAVHSGTADAEIKRTIKASKIQRDVDILNHVFDDLEAFMQLLKEKATAWTELERKSQKSRRKKNDAALEALKKKAEPPNEQEFIVTYQKCKYGINMIAKLGHHLSSPSAGELVREIFKYIQHFINLNKGPQLASGAITPLFTSSACSLMTRNLSPHEQELWNHLGMNWIMTIDNWPPGRPLPPEYNIAFSDGCIPPSLHNSSDSPANFPTLDTLPREQRSEEYSDAYDGDQVDESSRLMINPAVMAAVASKAAMVSSPILPGIVNRRLSDTSSGPSQQNLNSESEQEDNKKMAKVFLDYQASALEELTIRRGEKVQVLDDTRKWWKVKNRFGSEGFVPSNLLEVIIYKKSSKSDIYHTDNVINFHGRNVPAPPKFSPPPVPSPATNRKHNPNTAKYSSQMGSHLHGKSHHPQQLPTVTEVSESLTSTISRPHAPLPPPPPFAPLPPPQQGGPGVPPPPPPPGGGAPPPPPPPPPPIPVPVQQMSLSEMINQHKLKTAQQGKFQKKKLGNIPDNGIDIAMAIKTRKPLRKTSTSVKLEGVPESPAQAEIETKFRAMNISQGKAKDESDGATVYAVLRWKADKAQIIQWLLKNGYPKCAEKVNVKSGQELYEKDRDDLKDLFGVADGTRLFSHLQKDKSRAEKEGGAVKQSEFQKLMLSRRAAADSGQSTEPTITRGWGKSPSKAQDEPKTKPTWQEELARRRANKLTEKETVLDEPTSQPGDHLKHKDTLDFRSRKDSQRDSDRNVTREHSRKDSKRYEKDRGRGSHSRKTSRKEAISDDEGYRTRHRGRTKRDTWSDSDSDYEDRHRRRRRRSKHHRPTNIDDFDEDDYSDSDSYSSDHSDSSYTSDSDDSKRRRRRKIRSSSSVSELTGAAWALTGESGSADSISQRIKAQQAEIKKQLVALTQLQTETGIKALPSQHQTALQKDLEKLEQLQSKLRHKQGDQNLQMQLLGQQMLLCEHLKEAQQAIVKQPGLAHSTSEQNIRLQMIQQQQQTLAQQQRQLMFGQMQAEQQRQMMLAAEQRRQMQMVPLMPASPFVSPQPAYGMGGMPQIYSPYSGTVGYF